MCAEAEVMCFYVRNPGQEDKMFRLGEKKMRCW